jgi:hypothetical protein
MSEQQAGDHDREHAREMGDLGECIGGERRGQRQRILDQGIVQPTSASPTEASPALSCRTDSLARQLRPERSVRWSSGEAGAERPTASRKPEGSRVPVVDLR